VHRPRAKILVENINLISDTGGQASIQLWISVGMATPFRSHAFSKRYILPIKTNMRMTIKARPTPPEG
jgi:hypothetical protein